MASSKLEKRKELAWQKPSSSLFPFRIEAGCTSISVITAIGYERATPKLSEWSSNRGPSLGSKVSFERRKKD